MLLYFEESESKHTHTETQLGRGLSLLRPWPPTDGLGTLCETGFHISVQSHRPTHFCLPWEGLVSVSVKYFIVSGLVGRVSSLAAGSVLMLRREDQTLTFGPCPLPCGIAGSLML